MVGNPGNTCCFGIRMQGVFREAIALPQSAESRCSLVLVCTRDGTSRLPSRIGSHPAQPSLSFGEQRIVELPPSFQMPPDAFGLARIDLQRQFQQKRGGLLAALLVLFGLLCAHGPLLMLL